MNAKEKIIKARAQMVLDAPFFASLALRLPLIEDRGVETAYTNGEVLGFNPAFISGLSLSGTKALVAHEVMHLALMHHTRKKGRNHKRWNVACDYAINGILAEAGFKVPEGFLQDNLYAGLSAEAIYSRLPDGGGGEDENLPGPCGFGEVRDAPTPACGNFKQVEANWKIAIAQAARQAHSMGNLPGGIRRLVDEIVYSAVNWRELLRHFIELDTRSDYSWLPPSRRSLSLGIYLPGLHTKEPGLLVLAIDTSGSVDEQMLSQFAAEVSSLLEDFDTTVHVLYCDTKVQGVQTVDRQDLPLRLTPQGGGGTDFRPVFDWVEKEGVSPCCLVYLTDLECYSYPEQAPEYPVLWLCAEPARKKVPFGELININ